MHVGGCHMAGKRPGKAYREMSPCRR
ncbi:hypothetical protein ACFYQA_25270 [Streptomyces sp. NPDC005774]|uniref:Uncharacterized protein n=1 Tax=Streptomyces pratens TaxID=887456 RepID=A0ABW1M715_9ACTN